MKDWEVMFHYLALGLFTAFFAVDLHAESVSAEVASPLPKASSSNSVKLKSPDEWSGQKFSGLWHSEAGFESMEHGKDQGLRSHFGGYTEFDYKLSPVVSFHASPAVDFYAGRIQQRFENDEDTNRFSLTDTYVAILPLQELELRLGNISQRFIDNPLLVSRGRSFPGVNEIIHVDFTKSWKLDLVAEQTVPTSYSLNTERVDREPLPLFQTQSLHLTFRPNADWELVAWGGHYQWSNLPSKVAFVGGYSGNTLLDYNEQSARFAYNFDGVFGGIKGCWCGNGILGGEAYFSRLHNNAAPNTRRDGQLMEAGPRLNFRNFDLTMTYGVFFNERDTTPSYYTPSRFGDTNRVGQIGGLKLHFKNYKFSIVGKYIDADTINYDPLGNQQRLTSMLLGLETDNASF